MKVWMKLIICILIIGAFIMLMLLVYKGSENTRCERYSEVGFETIVDLGQGCRILYEGEFLSEYELNKRIELKMLMREIELEEIK